MRDHAHVFCSACRDVILCPTRHGVLAAKPPGWIETEADFFCSAACQEKGPAELVRERTQAAHIRMEKGINPHEQRGFYDALLGYDCVGVKLEYIKGHGNGMSVRAVIDAAVKKLGEVKS